MAEPVIVIGAGPAGLSCAVQLVDRGVPVQVFEASPYVGGLTRSMSLWEQTVDLGPHRFFSSDRIVTDHWRRFVGDDFAVVNRLSRILYDGRLFKYPIEPLDAARHLDLADAARAVASYAYARARPIAEPKTFEDWVTNRFGSHLFRLFFKTYSEKVWGISCARIDADWAAQRIKKLSLSETIRAAVLGNRDRHLTLVHRFMYPHGGAGSVYERMAEHVRAKGGRVRLSTPVKRVLRGATGAVRGVELKDGSTELAPRVVSTMPLTLMVKGLEGVPAGVQQACDRLTYRNTVLVYLEVDSASLFPDNWIYVHSPQVQHGRVTNFRNWSPRLYRGRPTTILCVELWCFDHDALWARDDAELSAQAERELRQIALLQPALRVLNRHVLRLHKSYPVYETGYSRHLEQIQGWLDAVPGLLPIGRYGAFKYNNQDHSILMGLLAATELLTGRSQRLWSVHTDQRYAEGQNATS
jgi:protoporphyrinogen oxidase